MKLRKRATVLLILGLVGLALDAGLGVAGVVLNQDLEARADETRRFQIDNQALMIGMVNQQSGLRGYVNTRDPTFLAPYVLGQTQALAALSRLDSESRGTSFRQAFLDVQARAGAWESWAVGRKQAVESSAASGGDLVAAQRGNDLFGAFRAADDRLASLADARAARAAAEGRRLSELTKMAVIAGSVGLALALVLLGTMLTAQVLAPISRLSAVAGELAAGKAVDVPDIERHDEVGALAEALLSWQNAETARRAAEAELRELFERSPVGLARMSLDGVVLRANQTLAELLGRPPEKVQGLNFREVTHPDDVSANEALYRELTEGARDSFEMDKRYRRPDGATFWGHLRVSVVRDGRRPRYFVASVENVEARKHSEGIQAAALAEFERLSRLKSDFVSVVSHEFRTALMAIQGFSELMRDQPLSQDEMKQYAADINSDARRLARLINDLLDLERMEAGRMTLSLETVFINELLRDAVERARVGSPSHSFQLRLDPAARAVLGDPDRLLQVVTNLLSNAVKYSPEGGLVEVASGREEGAVRVSVTDQGVGVPAEQLDRIFERYSRLESATTRGVVGTGLGLPIVKELVELHGGRIWVESRLHHGSTFHFTIPASAANVDAEDGNAVAAR